MKKLIFVSLVIHSHAVNPCAQFALMAERFKTFPKVYKRLLKEVAHLVFIVREHVAHRVNGALMLPDHPREFLFFYIHPYLVDS